MRTFILLAAAVLVLALVGWVTFSSTTGRSSINLETDEIKQDTKDMLESGEKMLDETRQSIDPAGSPEQSSPVPNNDQGRP